MSHPTKSCGNYYPFGMNMDGITPDLSDVIENRYQYNGKELEKDFGINLSDYGARWYDASIGRWTSVDPLADAPLNVGTSPYAYVWNSPINAVDPDGRHGEWIDHGDGSYTAQDGDDAEGFSKVANVSLEHANRMIEYQHGKLETGDVVVNKLHGMNDPVSRDFLYLPSPAITPVYPELFLMPLPKLGLLSKARGLFGFKAAKGVTNAIPRTKDVLGHIFRNAPGHVNPGTAASQSRYIKLFESVANNSKNLNPSILNPQAAKNGVQAYTQTFRNGKQVWVHTRNGRIFDAGVNIIPR